MSAPPVVSFEVASEDAAADDAAILIAELSAELRFSEVDFVKG
jgi:hypothetical protein